MKNKLFISNDQALALINWMLAAHFARKVDADLRVAFQAMREQKDRLTDKQLLMVQEKALALELMDDLSGECRTAC